MVNVLIVEDSRISRDSFERILTEAGDFKVVASISNAANAKLIVMNGEIDLILMDICTADDESGLSAAKEIKEEFPDVKIILMTSMPEYSFLRKAKEINCDSFWYKETGDVPLLDVVRQTLAGEFVWPEAVPKVKIGLCESTKFTERELSLIRELAGGFRYSEIADHLELSENTVKWHIKNILQKTGFRSTIGLVAEVVEKKFILPKY